MTVPRRRRIDHRCRAGLAIFSLALCMSCAPALHATADDTIIGSARDADTDEPIAGAWIFETQRRTSSGADVARVARARISQSDAEGRFSFDKVSDGFWGFSFGRRRKPRYEFYHPSYGLVRVRVGSDGRSVTLRPSLRDAHLRQADAAAFCNQNAADEMSKKMREIACPASRAANFGDGSPRATGAVDERGRREGPWTFFREDGSVIAQGDYRSGGAIGRWRFYTPESTVDHQEESSLDRD